MRPEWALEPATEADVEAACACSAAAFAQDALMHFFFAPAPMGVRAASERFFSILMRARLALGMPALVAREDGSVVGLAMGYGTAAGEWREDHTREWSEFESRVPGVAERFAAYERVADRFRPVEPHFYLGVLAVLPRLKGRGLGKALLQAFCAMSAADRRSNGVYLETASAESLAFYLRNGFDLRGLDDLDGMPLWCVFSPHGTKGQLPAQAVPPVIDA
jgi:GNAT superfamily N-acetyltransferase